MVDGINISDPISEDYALHIIVLFSLQYSYRRNSSKSNYLDNEFADENFNEFESPVNNFLENRSGYFQTEFLYTGIFNGLIIELTYSETKNKIGYWLTIRGSLHKFFFGDNACDFTLINVESAISKLTEILKWDKKLISEKGKIISCCEQINLSLFKCEFGINFWVGIDNIEEFLSRQLIQHKKTPFVSENGIFMCKHENYYLKIYKKAENLIRVEIVLLSKELKKYKIFKLTDIVPKKCIPIMIRFKKDISEILFSDGVNLHTCVDLTKKEELILLRDTSLWRKNDYDADIKSMKGKKGIKNLYQKRFRLQKNRKEIMNYKGKGYYTDFVKLAHEKIDCLIQKST